MENKKQINDNIIRITGNASILEGLEIDHDFKIEVLANVDSTRLKSRQDGTYDKHYNLKMLTCEVLKDDGKRLRAKDRRGVSQKMRGAIYGVQMDNNVDEDVEEFYQRSGNAIIANMEGILRFLKVIE